MTRKSWPAMAVVALQIVGWLAFVAGSFAAGKWIRRRPDRETAERASRVTHALFFAGLAGPANLGVFYPGLRNYDRLLGVRRLPFRAVTLPLGVACLAAGTYLMVASNLALRRLGQGANAFRLTRRVVMGDVYERTRNPMSLGYYLLWLGLGLAAGSTTVTLGSLLAMIPAHLFVLTYVEEEELALRLGESYLEYKARVPFLLPRLRRA